MYLNSLMINIIYIYKKIKYSLTGPYENIIFVKFFIFDYFKIKKISS